MFNSMMWKSFIEEQYETQEMSTPEVKIDVARKRNSYYSHNSICLDGYVWSQWVQS